MKRKMKNKNLRTVMAENCIKQLPDANPGDFYLNI